MTPATQSARSSATGPAPPIDFSRISFLVVDDQPFARRLVRSMLHSFGSREVYEAAGGTEALELLRTTVPNVIITDLVMPDLDGVRFIKTAKGLHAPTRTIPIIVLSGYLTKAAALEVRRAGAAELLVKPVSPKALHEHVSRVVQGIDPDAARTALLQSQRRNAAPGPNKTADLALI